MAKKKCGTRRSIGKRPEPVYRQKLPEELKRRLQTVWSRLGHLIDWCDSASTWTEKFCSEARPYREAFYWEAVAEMVSKYLAVRPQELPAMVLTDCLIATQSAPAPDDSSRMAHFRDAWGQILARSEREVEAFIEADLDLAIQEGTYEAVATQYAAEYQRWKNEERSAGK